MAKLTQGGSKAPYKRPQLSLSDGELIEQACPIEKHEFTPNPKSRFRGRPHGYWSARLEDSGKVLKLQHG